MLYKRTLTVLVALSTACATAGTHPPTGLQTDAYEGIRTAREALALTVAMVSPQGDLRCSGVWVAPYQFLTAEHCVTNVGIGGAVPYATFADLSGDAVTQRAGVLAHKDPLHDLALVTVRGSTVQHPSATLYARAVERGQKVAAMGHPQGLWWSYSEGEVAAVRVKYLPAGFADPVGEIKWVQATAPIDGGSSGGGLYDAGTGHLIGICSRGFGGGLNFWVHPEHIRAFLVRARVFSEEATSSPGASVLQPAPAADVPLP